MAFAKALQFCTNNQSETQAAYYILNWCKTKGITNIILGMDSLIVVNMLKGIYRPPWELEDDITYMRQIIQSQNIAIEYCYREGNESADAPSKH